MATNLFAFKTLLSHNVFIVISPLFISPICHFRHLCHFRHFSKWRQLKLRCLTVSVASWPSELWLHLIITWALIVRCPQLKISFGKWVGRPEHWFVTDDGASGAESAANCRPTRSKTRHPPAYANYKTIQTQKKKRKVKTMTRQMLGQAATTNQHDCNMRPTSFVGLQKKLFYAIQFESNFWDWARGW